MSERAVVLANLTWLVPGVVGGSEESVTDALRAVQQLDPPDLDLRLAVLEGFAGAHPDLARPGSCVVNPLDGSGKARRVLSEQTWLAARSRELGAAVVHHAGGTMPLVHPGRTVLTVHDLQPLDMAENFAATKRLYMRATLGRSVRAATLVHTPSEFTRRRVIDRLGADPDRVVTVPWSLADPGAEPGPGALAAVSEMVGQRQFFLYPAITYPHKNHTVLLDAFARVAEHDDVALVLTGGVGPDEATVDQRVRSLGLQDRVLRPGRLPREQLEALYRGALAVVFPSRYEGFGLPVLEAMARRVPVVASDAGSLPEVARAEDLVSPDDVTAWAQAMQSVVSQTAKDRAVRIAEGAALAATYTPERTATGLIELYRRARST